MTTVIVHGTRRADSARADTGTWWRASWDQGGFLRALADGMAEARGTHPDDHDIWRAGGEPLSVFPALATVPGATMEGLFEWSGTHMSLERYAGGDLLAGYLNAVARLNDEPLRIVAFSQGCNLVKAATSRGRLAAHVHIDRAVFLGCPHIHADSQSGRILAYNLDPSRVGRVLNISASGDAHQCGLLPNAIMGPASARWMAWVPPQGAATDPDPQARDLYENVVLEVDGPVTPDTIHAALHGAGAGRLAGLWLNGRDSLEVILRARGETLPRLYAGDTGTP